METSAHQCALARPRVRISVLSEYMKDISPSICVAHQCAPMRTNETAYVREMYRPSALEKCVQVFACVSVYWCTLVHISAQFTSFPSIHRVDSRANVQETVKPHGNTSGVHWAILSSARTLSVPPPRMSKLTVVWKITLTMQGL